MFQRELTYLPLLVCSRCHLVTLNFCAELRHCFTSLVRIGAGCESRDDFFYLALGDYKI